MQLLDKLSLTSFGVAMVIVKNLDATSGDTNWSVLHKSHFGTNNHLYLNLTNANDSNASRFNGTAYFK